MAISYKLLHSEYEWSRGGVLRHMRSLSRRTQHNHFKKYHAVTAIITAAPLTTKVVKGAAVIMAVTAWYF